MIIAFAGKPEKETKPGLQIYSDAQKKRQGGFLQVACLFL